MQENRCGFVLFTLILLYNSYTTTDCGIDFRLFLRLQLSDECKLRP